MLWTELCPGHFVIEARPLPLPTTVWLYLEIRSLGASKGWMRSYRWDPNFEGLWPYRKREERDPTRPAKTQSSLCHHVKTCKKVALCKSGKEPSLESEPCLNLDLQLVVLPNWEEINCCWQHPVCCIWLRQPEQSMGVCVGTGCQQLWRLLVEFRSSMIKLKLPEGKKIVNFAAFTVSTVFI